MYATNLRKVGGSVMMVIPPAILEMLHLQAGATVGLTVEHGQLVVEPSARPRYRLEDLLAQCDGSVEVTPEEQAWLNDKPAGGELL